jgi:hypothetical protein
MICSECNTRRAVICTGCSSPGYSWSMYVCRQCCIRLPADSGESSSSPVYGDGSQHWSEWITVPKRKSPKVRGVLDGGKKKWHSPTFELFLVVSVVGFRRRTLRGDGS